MPFPERTLVVFQGGSVWTILIGHPIGTALLVIVIYTFYGGIFRRC